MRTVVCVPWRGSEPHRGRAWRTVRTWWDQFDYEMFSAAGPDGPMNRSAARNQAAAAAGEWDVAVFADADTIGQPELIPAAVEAAQQGVIAYPFTRFEGWTPQQTQAVYQGRPPGRGRGVKHPSPGGILAVDRALFETVGGWDEKFVGWGYEDLAFAVACRTLGGVHREPGTIYHLWHPVAAEKPAAIRYKTTNRARRDRYKQVDGDPEAMRKLLVELGMVEWSHQLADY